LRDADYFTPVKFGPRLLSFPQRLVTRPFTLFSPASGLVVLVETIHPVSSAAASVATVRLTWSEAGKPRLIQNFSTEAVRLRAEDADSLLNGFAANLAETFGQTGLNIPASTIRAEINKVMVRPRFLPVITEVFMDDDGRAWLRQRNESDWFVLTRGTAAVEVVSLPYRAQPLAARGSTLWYQIADASDLPVLIHAELVKR
jgi:hypothetical protein